MKYYLGYWKYKDWVDTRDESPPHEKQAYHSDADIMEDITPGSELWLFTRITRNPKRKTIHVVQKISVRLDSPPFVRKKKRHVVVGDGLATSTSIQATQKAIDDEKDCWLEVLSRMETVRGASLKSDTAGTFAQRVQSPRAITPESAALLAEEWKRHLE